MQKKHRWIFRGLTVSVFALGAAIGPASLGGLHTTRALAAPPQVPNRCFSPVGTTHVVFGPDAGIFNGSEPIDQPQQSAFTSFSDNFNPSTLTGPTIGTYPLHTGHSPRGTTYYIITEASDQSVAEALGVNWAPKLANLLGPINGSVMDESAQDVGLTNGDGIQFAHGVNFAPAHIIVPSIPAGFPPIAAAPGAVGDTGYSPLIQTKFNGTPVILNTPQLANPTGRADKVLSLSTLTKTISYALTDGCYDNESVHYISTEASDPGAAAIEDVTFAPALNLVPSPGCADGLNPPPNCSRESLAAVTNGQTGRFNIQRQGLNAALLDHISPLNNLKEVPHPGAGVLDYSPIWDVHLTTWKPSIPVSQRLRFTNFPDIVTAATNGTVTGFPYPTPWGPSGFVVNCPVISIDEGD